MKKMEEEIDLYFFRCYDEDKYDQRRVKMKKILASLMMVGLMVFCGYILRTVLMKINPFFKNLPLFACCLIFSAIFAICTQKNEKINNLITLSGQLSAKDYHELMFYYELKERLTICLTLIEHLKARKETRWHSFAENLDHPQKSDDWKKYVNTKKVDGEIKVILRELVKEDEQYEHQN